MNNYLQKYATGKNILILMGIMLLFEFVFFPQFLPKGEHARSLDTEIAYNADDAYEIIGNYSDSMRQRYIYGEVTLDLIFPVIYTLLFSFLIFFLFKNPKLAFFPFIQLVFDYLENTGIVIMLSVWPHKIMWLAGTTSVFSMIKWGLAGVTVLVIVVGITRTLIHNKK